MEFGHFLHDSSIAKLVHKQVEISIVEEVKVFALIVLHAEGKLERVLVVPRHQSTRRYSMRLDPAFAFERVVVLEAQSLIQRIYAHKRDANEVYASSEHRSITKWYLSHASDVAGAIVTYVGLGAV